MSGSASDYFVRSVPLPKNIDGVTVPNDDGTFDIYLNSAQPIELQRRWLQHELQHIESDHFYRETCITEKEHEADAPRPAPKDEIKLFHSLDTMLDYYTDFPWKVSDDCS